MWFADLFRDFGAGSEGSTMDLYTLCEKIGLQKEMKDQIHAFMCHYDVSNLECYIEALRQQDTSEEAHRKLVHRGSRKLRG